MNTPIIDPSTLTVVQKEAIKLVFSLVNIAHVRFFVKHVFGKEFLDEK